MELFHFHHSLKDIPIPPKDYYTKTLIEKTEDFIGRMRWAAFHFLNPTEANKKKQPLQTFGFKTTRTPPQINETAKFEAELYKIISNIDFVERKSYNQHQNKLLAEVNKIKQSKNVFLFADKSTNVYEVSPDFYQKLLVQNVTKDYTIAEQDLVKTIDREAKNIATKLELADRIECHNDATAFVTIKDHKADFQNKPTCRLINPAKSQMGKISKQLVQAKNAKLRETTGLNQWQSTKEVISWFKRIQDKKNKSFLQLDIESYYPSISKKLLDDAFLFAERNGVPFTEQEKEIITHSRKSMLFAKSTKEGDTKTWQKTLNPDFDVTMGAPDGAEICELVGLYILDVLRQKVPEMKFGLYRDDGLAEHPKMNGRTLEKLEQRIRNIFSTTFGLKITIQKDMDQVDFLDVTFRLPTEDYKPFKKPNNRPLYVHTGSSHPPAVIRQIPVGINTRLSHISSSEEHFDNATHDYQKALNDSGHDYRLSYEPPKPKRTKKRNDRPRNNRNIIWYNPPFSLGVRSNIGAQFLGLANQCFPEKHPLRTIFNKNTLKISYSCTKNFKQIMQAHNKRILSNTNTTPNEKTCNCQKEKKHLCPLKGKCVQKDVIYTATTTEDEPKTYIGSTEDFKKRYNSHTFSFRHETHKNATTLSHHIWEHDLGTEPELKWEIIDKAPAYYKGGRACQLCLTEKLHIMRIIGNASFLNKRSELAAKCRHKAKFRLCAVK